MKSLLILIAVLILSSCKDNSKIDSLTTQEIKEDLDFLENFIETHSSYSNLNGYNYKPDFSNFLKQAEAKSITKTDLGIFLTKTIGEMGDRHAYVSRYDIPNSKVFPFAFAPFQNKIVLLNYNKEKRTYHLYNEKHPFLKAIDKESVQQVLPKFLPEEIRAPKDAFFTRAVRELRDIEKLYTLAGKQISDELEITLTNETGNSDSSFQLNLVDTEEKINKWDEKFYRTYFNLVREEEDYNLPEVYNLLFTLKDNIAYVHLPKMVDRDEAPDLYTALNSFMQKDNVQNSKALIIDVRSNKGGGRELIMELAQYIIHPDSIHVVNVAQQRGKIPLNEDLIEDLNNRFLFEFDDFNEEEKQVVTKFKQSFEPMYQLDKTRFSEYHYCLLNGKKISKKDYYYKQPVYVLANERSFSAASILVAVFKGIPNITIAGVTTDGSSGNSERYKLPNSELSGKISTMVSFQKDGKILDGHGTQPDLRIERDLEQIFWKRDSQLEELKKIIKEAAK